MSEDNGTKKKLGIFNAFKSKEALTINSGDITAPVVPKRTGAMYKLNDNAGSFILVGLVRSKSVTLHQIKHITTGETVNISPSLFNLLFTREQ